MPKSWWGIFKLNGIGWNFCRIEMNLLLKSYDTLLKLVNLNKILTIWCCVSSIVDFEFFPWFLHIVCMNEASNIYLLNIYSWSWIVHIYLCSETHNLKKETVEQQYQTVRFIIFELPNIFWVLYLAKHFFSWSFWFWYLFCVGDHFDVDT